MSVECYDRVLGLLRLSPTTLFTPKSVASQLGIASYEAFNTLGDLVESGHAVVVRERGAWGARDTYRYGGKG